MWTNDFVLQAPITLKRVISHFSNQCVKELEDEKGVQQKQLKGFKFVLVIWWHL
jgi:hypothetical protein